MADCRQFPHEDVHDWGKIEHCIHDVLSFTGAESAAIAAITARMKRFHELCDREGGGERERRRLIADLMYDRLKIETELYYARTLEPVP